MDEVTSERGREALYIGCVYMPTDSKSFSVRWWNEQIKDKINACRKVYKKVANG